MGHYRLAVLPGDGIGPEIVRETVRVLEAVQEVVDGLRIDFVTLPVGLSAYEEHGSTLPQETIAGIKAADGCLLGPVTSHVYDVNDPRMVNPSGYLRKKLDLYANVRPSRSFAGVPCLHKNVDLIVVRENTEGFYADRNLLDGNGELRPTEDLVMSVRVITRRASTRVARMAFRLAQERLRQRGKAKVTIVHKANVLRKGDGLFLEACRAVAQDYPDIAVDDYHVDAFAMHLVMRPAAFDVIVTTNLYGDVLSDEAAGLVGGLGLAPGLNAGDDYAIAQATHGSAPDIAGRNIANPCAEILSAQLLLNWWAQRRDDDAAREAARRIEAAVAAVLNEGAVRTPDLGGTATTTDMGQAIIDRLRAMD